MSKQQRSKETRGEESLVRELAKLRKENAELREHEKALLILRERIKESELAFRKIADDAPVMIWIADEKGHRFWVNKAWREFTGVNRAQGQHYKWLDLIHTDDVGRVYEKYMEGIERQNAFSFSYRMRSRDGTYRWVQSIGRPNTFSFSSHGFVGTIVDIHDQKASIELRDEFIGVASHELNTPLTTARLYLQLIMKELEGGTHSELLSFTSHAYEAMLRMSTLIKDMTSITELSSQKMIFKMKKVHVDTFLEYICDEIQKLHPDRTIICNRNADALMQIDERRFKQVIENLVGNAIKYSEKNEPVIIQSSCTEDLIRISVTDKGIGISESEHKKIFQSFYQTSVAEKKIKKGIGLGLHVTRQLVEAHGGSIEVVSTPGIGSTFTVVLPKISQS